MLSGCFKFSRMFQRLQVSYNGFVDRCLVASRGLHSFWKLWTVVFGIFLCLVFISLYILEYSIHIFPFRHINFTLRFYQKRIFHYDAKRFLILIFQNGTLLISKFVHGFLGMLVFCTIQYSIWILKIRTVSTCLCTYYECSYIYHRVLSRGRGRFSLLKICI